MNAEKKRVEAYMLAAARKAGVPIPNAEIADEEPDFRFNDEVPGLGIEVSEVLRPASSNHGILPVEQESFHKAIITKAQQDYDAYGAKPVHVSVYFTNTRGGKRDKKELALALTEFVKANVEQASPFVSLYRPETPDGFDSVVISADSSRDWWCGEGGGYSLDDIRPQLAARISSKDRLVPTYRANLPAGARVWLLLYTGVTVARSMMIPAGIEEWTFPFRFERVFWYAALEGQFAEIQRAEAATVGQ
jgi:hypothetical protein